MKLSDTKHTILRTLLWLLWLTVPAGLTAQTINGTVTDASNGETLIGATILDQTSGKGTVSNAYGRYTLTLSGDSAYLRISYIGYRTEYRALSLRGNRQLNIALTPSVQLDEVTITAERVTSPKASQMSAIELPVEHLKMVPVIFGEADVLKAIQLLPGVQGGTEGTSGIYVRGGGPDENLFLLDGVPLYNVNHLGGFFSAFNSDAIKNVTLYKGSFPAHFTGRISSVLDITTNNGNDREWHGGASIGLLAGKLNIEGPIIKERTTLCLSARRTYGDLLLLPLMTAASLGSDYSTSFGYHFYDINAKVVHKFNDRSRLYASLYAGDDVLKFGFLANDGGYYGYTFKEELGTHYNWGNLAAALRWNYVINPKLFMNLTATFTRYRNDLDIEQMSDFYWSDGHSITDIKMTYNSGISDITARADFDYTPLPEHNIRFGGSLIHHRFAPEVLGAKYNTSGTGTTGEHIDTTLGQSIIFAEEAMLYAEDDYAVTDALKFNGGLALSTFFVQGRTYFNPQPRLSGRFLITDDLSIKAGYAYMAQYLHLLSNGSISLPTDLWVPVTARLEPMTSHQVAAGVFYTLNNWVDLSVEGYYKWMNNLMEYRNGSSFWSGSVGWEDKVCLGRGWAYGIEFLAQRSVGKFTGWVGYTWSRTLRCFDMLNNGEPFPAKYDRIHDVSISLQYKPNDEFDCGITWVYSTGNTATLAMQEIPSDDYDPDTYIPDVGLFSGIINDGSYYGYVSSRNNFRMPSYHRMDVSANFHRKLRHFNRTIALSVYNVYNHKNPFLIYKSYKYHTTIGNQTYGASLVKQSVFPIIPSVSYILKF